LRFISFRMPCGATHRFSLQILESSSSVHSLFLLEIGGRHHA
jgi:hypothetical protein